ncbi:progesterone-induced-blocking factor 1-like isoform X2 [Watersipora subatra]|uniref:progesterone-induced-blocking factor 1-like isoform X2 n=1 Tax=Watersipora subatra TaxID=2589382 RepID=UPI00355B0D69
MDEHGEPTTDVSIDSSVPTDLSISEITDIKMEKSSRQKKKGQQQKEKDRMARELIEKKQLEHDLQLVQIERNQKEYLLESIRTEYKMRVGELQEKLDECKHQKKLNAAKAESQLAIQEDTAKRRQERLHSELSVVKVHLRELEAQNKSLIGQSDEVKVQLKEHVDINEQKYYELRATTDQHLSVKDLVAMRIFESLRPYKMELDEVKIRCDRLSKSCEEAEKKSDTFKQELDEERREHAKAQLKLSRLITESQDLQAKASTKDYRINNYERVNKEKDEFEREAMALKERNQVLESEFSVMARDKKHFEQEFERTKSALSLATQDKEYLTRQVCDMTNKLAHAEERMTRQIAEIDEIKTSREQLFEKYVSSRDQYKVQYEQQLQVELRQMSASTQEEVEKLRCITKAMYEVESRALKESRDTAITERDRAVAQEAELKTRYQKLSDQCMMEKTNFESQLSQLRADMKMAEYERSRSNLLHDEMIKNMKDCQLENEKMLKKLEVANKEYYNLEMKCTTISTEYESRSREYQVRLEAYENIEKELDEVIMQAAEVETEEGSEKAMLSYGYGASIPSSSQRRMKQSVHLARRCLALERQMVGEKREMKELELANSSLRSQLEGANEKLAAAGQPYDYMLSKTEELERSNKELQQANHSMKLDLKSTKNKYQQAVAELQRISLDQEFSRKHGEELSFMREQLNNILSRSASARSTMNFKLERIYIGGVPWASYLSTFNSQQDTFNSEVYHRF